jgi:pimeloyl-ACP methyl ester carboxylesterase
LAAEIPAVSGVAGRFAEVNGVRLHYRIGGSGDPVVLLHGYTQTGHMWHPIVPTLAERHTVIVPDLRGAGGSAKPDGGYDKKTLALDIHALTTSLGFGRVSIVGHDIGLMVAYAFAAQFPQAIQRVVLMDAFLPGIGNWKAVAAGWAFGSRPTPTLHHPRSSSTSICSTRARSTRRKHSASSA